ncbi:hypothetical protein BEWA_015060 [Theileria equi strain WA]|uniref:Uncharacterized protein n=1 Tax=Theileria equi strain WA TaxID=1537102 RepID=L1LBX5_THEEQ|nr:hypothetical protein BEWA_015060 [Theileria equi strain WA]EKX72947.1 hypothetical protein BEWA_015060 [Theileria equi strain WA]|eukprot:XP_004832399.1 hypothetical protein BEWA_015060 [Theileria equi strain WA]
MICGINDIKTRSTYAITLGDDENTTSSMNAMTTTSDTDSTTLGIVTAPSSSTYIGSAQNDDSETSTGSGLKSSNEEIKSEPTPELSSSLPTESESEDSKELKDSGRGSNKTQSVIDDHKPSTSTEFPESHSETKPLSSESVGNKNSDDNESKRDIDKGIVNNPLNKDSVEAPKSQTVDDVEVIEAPAELMNLILGDNVSLVGKPELVLSLQIETLNMGDKITKPVRIDVVESDEIKGPYYRIALQNNGNLTHGSFLVQKHSADQVMRNDAIEEEKVPLNPLIRPKLRRHNPIGSNEDQESEDSLEIPTEDLNHEIPEYGPDTTDECVADSNIGVTMESCVIDESMSSIGCPLTFRAFRMVLCDSISHGVGQIDCSSDEIL